MAKRLPDIEKDDYYANLCGSGNKDELSVREAIFVSELLAHPDMSRTEAARKAGFKGKNVAQNLVKKARVRNAIERGIKERITRTLITQDKLVCELAKIGFSDISEILEVNPATGAVRVKSLDEIKDCAFIESIKQDTYFDKGEGEEVKSLEIKLHSKLQALKQLADHLGFITKKLEVKGKIEGEVPALNVFINGKPKDGSDTP